MRWSRGEAVCCVIPKAEGKPTGPAAPCATPAANASAPETSARIPATPRARVEPGLEGPERRVWPGAGPSFAPPSPDRLRRAAPRRGRGPPSARPRSVGREPDAGGGQGWSKRGRAKRREGSRRGGNEDEETFQEACGEARAGLRERGGGRWVGFALVSFGVIIHPRGREWKTEGRHEREKTTNTCSCPGNSAVIGTVLPQHRWSPNARRCRHGGAP